MRTRVAENSDGGLPGGGRPALNLGQQDKKAGIPGGVTEGGLRAPSRGPRGQSLAKGRPWGKADPLLPSLSRLLTLDKHLGEGLRRAHLVGDLAAVAA